MGRKAAGYVSLLVILATGCDGNALQVAPPSNPAGVQPAETKRTAEREALPAELEVSVRPEVEEETWYAVDSSFTRCFAPRGGPARVIEDSVGRNIDTRDYKDRTGNIYKVEIRDWDARTVSTFYRSKTMCENEKVKANKSLADKYR